MRRAKIANLPLPGRSLRHHSRFVERDPINERRLRIPGSPGRISGVGPLLVWTSASPGLRRLPRAGCAVPCPQRLRPSAVLLVFVIHLEAGHLAPARPPRGILPCCGTVAARLAHQPCLRSSRRPRRRSLHLAFGRGPKARRSATIGVAAGGESLPRRSTSSGRRQFCVVTLPGLRRLPRAGCAVPRPRRLRPLAVCSSRRHPGVAGPPFPGGGRRSAPAASRPPFRPTGPRPRVALPPRQFPSSSSSSPYRRGRGRPTFRRPMRPPRESGVASRVE